MCRDVSDGDAEVVLLGNPLLDVKLLGRVGISRSARLFRHLARFETAADLGGLMSPFTYLVSVDMLIENASTPLPSIYPHQAEVLTVTKTSLPCMLHLAG